MLPFGAYGYNIAVLVISIMIGIDGIILGLGFATNTKKLKELGKAELMQSIISGIIVGSLLALFAPKGPIANMISQLTFANGTSFSCTGALKTNPAICFAYNYLVDPSPYRFMNQTNYSVLDIAFLLLVALYSFYAALSLFSQFLAPILSQVKYLTQAISYTMISANVQAALLAFAASSSLTLIIPLGIILRAFYPTRKLGGLLIAIAIGMYVIMPLSYVFDAEIASGFTSNIAQSLSQIQMASTGVEQIHNTSVIGSIYNFIKPLLQTLANTINILINEVAYLIVYAFVLPLFSLVITLVGIREIAQLLGSDASLLNKINLV